MGSYSFSPFPEDFVFALRAAFSQSRTVLAIWCCSLIFASGACKPDSKPPAADSPSIPSRASADSTEPTEDSLRVLFRLALANLDTSGATSNESRHDSPARRCHGDTSEAHTNDCILQIRALRATEFDQTRIPFVGSIVAEVKNKGPRQEYWLELEPGSTYYWWIRPNRRTYLVGKADLSFRPKTDRKKLTLKECKDGSNHPGRGLVGFYCCKGACRKDSDPYTPGRPGVKPLDLHTSPPWISCQGGCCYADI